MSETAQLIHLWRRARRNDPMLRALLQNWGTHAGPEPPSALPSGATSGPEKPKGENA